MVIETTKAGSETKTRVSGDNVLPCTVRLAVVVSWKMKSMFVPTRVTNRLLYSATNGGDMVLTSGTVADALRKVLLPVILSSR